ncbi:hypothetical protein GCM10025771_22530 [Niveibacterium umoris]|uniref:ABC-type amino acid transport substrate-binding protein n=1 Tax=Niveibacterium umoris TaxID=1193620 RepID=A0A840BLX1_9RHOO|nr:transporter substrate-binding domain-containing protein [Niveibacterium umoris]MBB4012558.1 ABC-type amino acid transport substrate-binding protein [Niveibacterium umoris]
MDRRYWQTLGIFLALVIGASPLRASVAAPPLRMAHIESLRYPLLEVDAQGKVSGGILKELGDRIAVQLGTQAQHISWSRRRAEPAVLSGDADIACYLSPQWSDQARDGLWTVAVLPQIERVVTATGKRLPETAPQDFKDLRIAIMLGYHYPSIQGLFDSREARAVEDTRVENLFRLVMTDRADALITSEAEIEGQFRQFPDQRARFKVGTQPFTVVDTQCLVSPKSHWSLDQFNTALRTLAARGEIERLAHRYGMSMR